jgi:hypothetical protein
VAGAVIEVNNISGNKGQEDNDAYGMDDRYRNHVVIVSGA